MDKAARFFYHLGWLVGVGWLVIGAGHIFIGLRAQSRAYFYGWGTCTLLGAAMFALGVGWVLLWYFQYHYRTTARNDTN